MTESLLFHLLSSLENCGNQGELTYVLRITLIKFKWWLKWLVLDNFPLLVLVFILFNLRSKVVTNVSEVWNLIFNYKWNICWHAQTNLWQEQWSILVFSLGIYVELFTCADSGVAFVNEFKYWQANVKVTGSCISIVTASSSLSTADVCANLMFADPASPVAENRTPSFVHVMTTDSPNWLKSRQIRANSVEGSRTMQA